jgi:hypothetical protein
MLFFASDCFRYASGGEGKTMARLTKRFVESLQPTDTDQYIWDTSISGFGVRVWPSGRRSYIVQYRTQSGQQRRRTIGRHGIVTVEQARTKAQEMLAEVRLGGDPAKPPTPSAVSVADLADRYLREYAVPKKKPKSVKSDAASLRLHILPRFGQKLVPEVIRADISDLQYQMRETPIAANRTIEVISKMFNLAEEWGLRAEGTNPTLRIHPYPETKRERYLSPAELARLGPIPFK